MNVSEKHLFVSVIMPTYNVEKYIEEAVNSILNQTFSDFEFIIVDDGSTDRTPEILRSFSDPRIRLLFNEKNEGNYPARNRGCRLAIGKYIAVMDADDVAMPERLEVQVKFLEEHPDVLACGTAYRLMGKNKIIVQPVKWAEIRYCLLMTYCMLHPTMMIQTEVMNKMGFYKEESICAEDYDLTLRLAVNGKIVNIPNVLLDRRLHSDQISSLYSKKQNMYGSYIQIRYQHEMGIFYPPKDNDIFLSHLAAYISSIVSYVEEDGLLHGKMGLILFFYCYYRYSTNTGYLELADRMVVSKTMFDTDDWSFESGFIGVVYYVSYRLGCEGKRVENIFNSSYRNKILDRIKILENHAKWNNPYSSLLEQCSLNLQGNVSPIDWNKFFKMLLSPLPTTFSLGGWEFGLKNGAAGVGMSLILGLNI